MPQDGIYKLAGLLQSTATQPIQNTLMAKHIDMIMRRILLAFTDKALKASRLQSSQHLLGILTNGKCTNLYPIQRVSGDRFGGFGLLRLLERHAEVVADAVGDGLGDGSSVLHEPAGTIHGVVELALDIGRGCGRYAYLVEILVHLNVLAGAW